MYNPAADKGMACKQSVTEQYSATLYQRVLLLQVLELQFCLETGHLRARGDPRAPASGPVSPCVASLKPA